MNRIITKSKILVTGGAGFIGSHLVDSLLAHNNQVIVLDNFSTGKRENIQQHLNDPNFSLIEGDIRDQGTCKKACSGVDYILHEAALGSVPRSINNPLATHEVNCTGFLNMLIAARDEGVKRFVYAASSSTYGDHPDLPKIEENIGKPLSPYAVTKYTNELYADVFAKTYGLEVIGLRYFNVFGARQDPNGAYAAVIPKFIKAMKDGEQVTINGDGSHSRDFTYVENVVQINHLSLTSQNKESLNQVYNVACGGNTSLLQLYRKIQAQFSKEILEPIFGPERQGDVKHSFASIEKAQNLLGYSPQYDFEEGIKKTIDWYNGSSSFSK